MNILIVHFDNINTAGGGPEVIKQVASRLSLFGNKITVITTSTGIRSNMDAKDYLKKHMIDLYEISVLGPTSIPSLKSKKIIKMKFQESNIIYFFVRMGGLEHYLLKLQNSLKRPVIAGHHSEIGKNNIKISMFQRVYYKIFGGRDGRTIKGFAGQHVLNKEDFETLVNRNFQEIFLIPNGIELDRYYVNKKKGDKFIILYLARLEPEKGVKDIPEMLDLLLKNGVFNFKLIVCGDGSLKDYVSNMSKKYTNISFQGYVSNEKKLDFLSKSHILVSLSHSEAFGLSILEGIASGTPVVAIDNPGVHELIRGGENSYLVNSVNEMVEKILDLYNTFANDFDSYLALSRRCRESSQNYNWDSVVARYRDMFSEVIRKFNEK